MESFSDFYENFYAFTDIAKNPQTSIGNSNPSLKVIGDPVDVVGELRKLGDEWKELNEDVPLAKVVGMTQRREERLFSLSSPIEESG